jgi:predicted O-linked N-acetylglucosamine transferase (SPINDLY family)
MLPDIQKLIQLALQHDQAGRWRDAEGCYRQVLSLDPGHVQAHNNIANILVLLGRNDEAEHHYRLTLGLIPESVVTHNNFANLLIKLGRVEEAVQGYRRALALDGGLAEVHANLAIALQKLDQLSEAERSYREALSLAPDRAVLHNDLGAVVTGLRRLDEAESCYRRALALSPDFSVAHDNLALLLGFTGRLEEAIGHYREALTLRPDFVQAYSHLLSSLSYVPRWQPAQIYAEHLAFGKRISEATDPEPESVNRDPDRKLRIGYVSGDFRDHAVACFMEPVLSQHDHDAFTIYCYYNYPRSDEVTHRLRSAADSWCDVHALGDEALAHRIREDSIDILVDLSGHSAGNRLLVFARKPAPVQVSYLGYPGTTGLSAMDYRLTDAIVDPEGEGDRWSVERLVRLPGAMWCYRPHDSIAKIAPRPTLPGNPATTFGSFNNCPKVNPQVLALWALLLGRLPGSRLILTNIPAGRTQESILRILGERGIAGTRLEVHDRLPREQFNSLFSRTDIALDTFPYAGTTTTCDVLWMGIPTVTLAGETVAARSGASLLGAVGLQELVARTTEQYLHIATALATDHNRLRNLRTGLRARMATSPLMDEARFTRNLEHAYRSMWHTSCERGFPVR